MKGQIKTMLQGIERYNPDNIKTLEHYVDLQVCSIVNILYMQELGTSRGPIEGNLGPIKLG